MRRRRATVATRTTRSNTKADHGLASCQRLWRGYDALAFAPALTYHPPDGRQIPVNIGLALRSPWYLRLVGHAYSVKPVMNDVRPHADADTPQSDEGEHYPPAVAVHDLETIQEDGGAAGPEDYVEGPDAVTVNWPAMGQVNEGGAQGIKATRLQYGAAVAGIAPEEHARGDDSAYDGVSG